MLGSTSDGDSPIFLAFVEQVEVALPQIRNHLSASVKERNPITSTDLAAREAADWDNHGERTNRIQRRKKAVASRMLRGFIL